jgi:hypothetical protein
MPQEAHVGMYSSRHFHKNFVEGNAYITVGDPCKFPQILSCKLGHDPCPL